MISKRSRTTLKGFAMKRVSLVLILALAAGLSTEAATAQTLKTVKDRGMVSCGVSQGLPGFSTPDDKGNWTGLDVDVCSAIAAAIFNDTSKVKFGPLSAKDRSASRRVAPLTPSFGASSTSDGTRSPGRHFPLERNDINASITSALRCRCPAVATPAPTQQQFP
jgi:hypothetical protein